MPEAGHRDVCRLCVVEVQGAGRLLPACSTPATAGMVIATANDHVRGSRRATLELLIGSGRHTCITCEALGACELSRLAYEYGVEPPAELPPEEFPLVEDAWVIRDYSKCILCGRCWAACTAIQVHGVVPHPSGRRAERAGGKDWYPLPDLKECAVCGQCIDACPVGALTERRAKGVARAWELERIRSTCPHCGMGCQTLVHVKAGEVIKVTGAGDAAPNRGRLCRRGRFAVYEPDERERLTTPLLRRDGELVPATWDEALAAVAEGLSAAVERRGPDAVAGLVSPSRTNEDAYQAQKFFRAVIGTNNVDHRSAAASLVPLVEPGSGATACYARGAVAVLEEARAILVVGDGDIDEYPVAGAAVRRAVREGARLMVLDAGHNTLGQIATTHVCVDPHAIPGVLNGLESVLLAGELAGRGASGEPMPHKREIELLLSAYLPESVAETSGVAADTIRAIAQSLVDIRPAVVLATLGADDDMASAGASIVRLQALLDDLAGARSVSLPRGGGNAQGMLAMGVAPGLLPGDAFVGNEIAARRFAEGWDVRALPTRPGLSTAELLAALVAGEVEAVWICADDASAFGAGRRAARRARSRRPCDRSGRRAERPRRGGERRAAVAILGRRGRHLHERRAPHQPRTQGAAPSRRCPPRLVDPPRDSPAHGSRVGAHLSRSAVGRRDRPTHPQPCGRDLRRARPSRPVLATVAGRLVDDSRSRRHQSPDGSSLPTACRQDASRQTITPEHGPAPRPRRDLGQCSIFLRTEHCCQPRLSRFFDLGVAGPVVRLDKRLDVYRRHGVDAAFWFTFAGWDRPHRSDPREDLDMASFGVVKVAKEATPVRWSRKAVFSELAGIARRSSPAGG